MKDTDYPFQFDNLYYIANELEREGSYAVAGFMFLYLARNYGNEIWMYTRSANAFFYANRLDTALECIRYVNSKRPSVASYLVEARIWGRCGELHRAVHNYTQAKEILENDLHCSNN